MNDPKGPYGFSQKSNTKLQRIKYHFYSSFSLGNRIDIVKFKFPRASSMIRSRHARVEREGESPARSLRPGGSNYPRRNKIALDSESSCSRRRARCIYTTSPPRCPGSNFAVMPLRQACVAESVVSPCLPWRCTVTAHRRENWVTRDRVALSRRQRRQRDGWRTGRMEDATQPNVRVHALRAPVCYSYSAAFDIPACIPLGDAPSIRRFWSLNPLSIENPSSLRVTSHLALLPWF